jgi:hypothetical protein
MSEHETEHETGHETEHEAERLCGGTVAKPIEQN